MHTKEVASILRKTAEILDQFEEKDLDKALGEILLIVKKNSDPQTIDDKKESFEPNNRDDDIDYQNIITILRQKNGKEIEDYLNNEKVLKTKKALLGLAKAMSIASSTRQTKEVLKHSMIKYFERQKMDDIIRIGRD